MWKSREVSGKEDTSTCYTFLLQMKWLSPHWRPGLNSLNFKSNFNLTHCSKAGSHEDMWKEIKEKKLSVELLS